MRTARTAHVDVMKRHRVSIVGALVVLLLGLVLAGCGDPAPTSQPMIPTSAVTSLTLIRANGDQVVRAQVENPLDEAATFLVTVSLASPEGTKIGETTVTVANVPPGSKKSGNSDPLSPKVPARTSLVLSGVERATS